VHKSRAGIALAQAVRTILAGGEFFHADLSGFERGARSRTVTASL
jgi:hypothetical protein